jgi:3-dehydroquinate dehydratase
MVEMSDLQIYEIPREDFEKLGRSTEEEEEFIRMVMELLQGLDETRAKVILLDPNKVTMYTRALEVAARQVGLPVIVKTLSNGMAIALEANEERARQIRQAALTQPPSP